MQEFNLQEKLSQWHRIVDRLSLRARKVVEEIGTPLEIMLSETHYMTETELARLNKLQQIYNKLNCLERNAARERILKKRLLRKKA